MALAAAFALYDPAGSRAATCGGATPCACGDTVVASWTFDRHLNCGGSGLLIGANGITLNGNGFTLVGPGTVTPGVKGVATQSFDNTSLVGLNVSRFYWGINTESGAVGTVISGVWVHESTDEGIHLGSGSSSTTIQNSTIENSALENVYFLGTSNNLLTGNTMRGTGSNSVYIKDSSGNTFTGNNFNDRVATLTGSSTNNCFGTRDGGGNCVGAANTFTSARVLFDFVSGNSVIGASISAPNSSCVQFRSSNNNFVRATLVSCLSDRYIRAESSGTNTFHKGACSNPNPTILYDPPGATVNIQCCNGCC
jgi:parallel beta-helix repeat protein